MAVDIDGTLVDSNGELSNETKKAIALGVEKGLIFTISTGRPIQGVEPLIEQIGLDLPFITYNGAMVIMGESKKILYQQNLSAMHAKSIIELGKKYHTTIIVWVDNQLYVNRIDDRSRKYAEGIRVEPILMKDIDEIVKNGVTKVLWYDEPDVIERYENEVGQYLSDAINYHTSRPVFLEFVDKNASKAIAMKKLGEHYKISPSEMIAVGDGHNDLSMLEYAGLGVAMANAKEGVKKKADYITLSNDENGVAHAIHKFVLGSTSKA
jgi:Cof subfamily protein (haloacid dehalogenase superfamily)